MKMFSSIVFVIFLHFTQSQASCPTGCDCSAGYVVRCTNLTRIPLNLIPVKTTVLDFRDCHFDRVDTRTFWALPHLHTLVLNNCSISELKPGAFHDLINLRNLYLDDNLLRRIGEHTFEGLKHLKLLSIKNNKIAEIHAKALLPMSERLRVLYLDGNHLTHLPVDLLKNVPSLKHMRLDQNPFACNCELSGLAVYLRRNSYLESPKRQARCASPASYQGTLVAKLPMHWFQCRMPKIKKEPTSLNIKLGQPASFICEIDGDPRPQIVWIHNGQVINPSQNHRYQILSGGSRLSIEHTQNGDQGDFECVAENPAGTVRTRRAQLRYPDDADTGNSRRPYFTVSPRDLGVREGSRVEMFCRAEGSPKPTIQWSKGTRQINWSPRVQLENDNTVLIFTQLLHTDAGRYTCTASNAAGQVETHATIRVIPSQPPKITYAPEDKTVPEGATATFECRAIGDPEPYIEWLFNGSPIPARQGHYEISTDTTVLRIHRVTPKDTGHYWCQANNAVGSMSTDVQLTVVSDRYVGPEPEPEPETESAAAEPESEPESETEPEPETEPESEPESEPEPETEPEPAGGTTRRPGRNNFGSFERRVRPTPQSTFEVDREAEALARRFPKIRQRQRFRQNFETTTSGIFLDDNDPITLIIKESIAEATRNVDRAINATRTRLYSKSAKTPSELLELFRFPGPQAIELARAREIYEEAVSIIQRELKRGLYVNQSSPDNIGDVHYESVLSVSHLQMIMEMTGCTPGQFVDPCTDICYHSKYRSYDGQCNNFDRPMLGVSLMPFKRLLPAIYENGFTTPVGWETDRLYYGYKKPNARLVSMKVMSSAQITADVKYSSMLMQWGQFLDHDIDLAAAATSRHVFRSGAICNKTCEKYMPCFNIPIPEEDHRRQHHLDVPCIEFERSSAVCGSGSTSVIFKRVTPREQINMITSFIDGSQIYGSSEQNALDLRDLFSDHGLLRFDIVSQAQKPYLPFNRDAPMDCRRKINVTHPIRCFLAGDFRANEQLGLTAMHTIWLREHNRLASKLLILNAHWDGEKIYQETRKTIGAMLQHITYEHWLPKILGPYGMKMMPKYMGYDAKEDPSIANSFATAAFRFGHAMVNPTIARLDDKFMPIREGHLPLHEAFFAPERLLSEGGIDPILRGLFATATKAARPQQQLNKELTERLFNKRHHVALDLAALNIQRGRDHALPGYLAFRKWCNLSEPNGWLHFSHQSIIESADVIDRLRDLYGHPGNLDLWVAGMLEKPMMGARVGPTFACIIADQFHRLRSADRFWYESPGVFTALQLNEIRKSTLSKVICENADQIRRITKDVFMTPDHLDDRDLMMCDQLPDLNMNMWQECCDATCSAPAPTRPRSGVPGHGLIEQNYYDEHHDDHSMAEMQGRIDALEATIRDLKEGVDKMGSKMNEMGSSGGTHEMGCTVDGGMRKADGETWLLDACTRCTCKGHYIWCTTIDPCNPR